MDFLKLALLQLAPGGACFGVTLMLAIFFTGWLIQMTFEYKRKFVRSRYISLYKRIVGISIGLLYTCWWIYKFCITG
mgnify:CR=1 FL=1